MRGLEVILQIPKVRRSFLRGSWRLCTPSLGEIVIEIGMELDMYGEIVIEIGMELDMYGVPFVWSGVSELN